MRSPLKLGLILMCAVGPVLADDLRDADRILCSTLSTSVCIAGGDCAEMPPGDLNIPQFIEIEVKTGKLATTAASGENRETIAPVRERADGRLLLQGAEGGRAFSLMIQESTGQASFASVADGRGVIVFAACTPLQ